MYRRRRTATAHAIDALESRRLLSAVPVVVDVLALYTTNSKNLHGGVTGITSHIQASVDTMNKALIDSAISVTIRLVHTQETSYVGSNDLFLDRSRLETPGDGHLDEAHTLRDTWGADLVTLISDGPNVNGGNASLMTNINSPSNPSLAFSAIAENSIGTGFLTLAHELGHNLGGGHERGNPFPGQGVVGPFSYSYGYRYQSNGRWHNDIMSYSYELLEIPLPLFANPAISFDGAPTGKPIGDPLEADIASTFAQTAPVVANYRTTNVVSDTSGPAASVFEINRTGATLDVTVRYLDASGVDLSTLGAGDLTVSGPGGFVLPATFVSMDHPTIAGAYKHATYRVLLPATNPPTSSLFFNLAAGAVKDIYNNAAPAGALPRTAAHFAGYSYAWAQDLGTLTPGSTHTAYGLIEPLADNHFYQFTVGSTMTVGAALSGMTGNGNVLMASDANNNGWFDSGEEFAFSDNLGAADDATAEANLSPGTTYYVLVYPLASGTTTPYTLDVHAYTDTTPPTATLDATDVRGAAPTHIDFSVTYFDDNEVDGISALYDAGISVEGPYFFFYWPDSTLNTSRANAGSRTIHYRLFPYNGQPTFDSSYNGTYTVNIQPNPLRVHDGAGNNIVPVSIGSLTIALGGADTTAPTATLSAAPPVAGQTTWEFNVVYKDNTALNGTTLDNNDVRVTGPGGYDQLATFVTVTPAPSIGSQRVATYRVDAPGGYWDGTDDGNYNVAIQANQVRDTANIAVSAATIGAVSTSMPMLVSQGGGTVAFNGTASPDVLRLDADTTFVYFSRNDAELWYIPETSVTRAVAAGLGGDDTIYFQRGSLTGAVSGGPGTNTLHVTGGSLTLDTDSGAGATNVFINVSAGATTSFSASQHLTGLTVAGDATLSAGGGKRIVTPTLDVTGRLDVTDNDVIVDYTGDSPIAAIEADVASAYNVVGDWQGSGITSSIAAADGNFAVAVADNAALAAPFGSAQGGPPFAGFDVDPTSVLIKFTHRMDLTLDGLITPDDAAIFGTNYSENDLANWGMGDIDYDGLFTPNDAAIFGTFYDESLPPVGQVCAPLHAGDPAGYPPLVNQGDPTTCDAGRCDFLHRIHAVAG